MGGFRFSKANVIGGVAALCGFYGFKLFGQDIPRWINFGLLGLALVLAIWAGLIAGARSAKHFEFMEAYAEEKGWGLIGPLRWAIESKTFPMDGKGRTEVGAAWVGDFRGYWGATFEVEVSPRSSDATGLRTYQIIGFPFNDHMPRVQVVPEDRVENAYKMVGGKDIDFESADFNAAWRVRGEDAKRVHDIIHPRTMHRLLKPDARGVPIIIDGGAIWTWRAEPVSGKAFEAIMNVLVDVAVAIPAHVYKDEGVEFLKKSSDDLHADWVEANARSGKSAAGDD